MNNEDRPPIGHFFSFKATEQIAHEFLDLLARNGIQPVPGGSLERMTFSMYDALSRHEGDFVRPNEDIRDLLNDLAALGELALHVIQVQNHEDFPTILAHLKLLNEGEAAQTKKASVTDAPANLIFELVTACVAMRCGTRVVVELVGGADGANPDVLFDFDGRRWGIACKVLHSSHPQSILNNIAKGVDQIERSEAEAGFVFLSLKNVLDRERYLRIVNADEAKAGADPIYSAFADPEVAHKKLQDEVDGIGTSLWEHAGDPQILADMFAGKKAKPGALLYAHVLSALLVDGRARPMAQRWPSWLKCGVIEKETDEVLMCFHHYLQDVPDGQP